MGGLYIHVPFCGSICSYCHFARTADHDRLDREAYVAGVLTELDLRRDLCGLLDGPRRRLATAYLGGGTPSQLEPDLFHRLVSGTVGSLPVAPDLEFTAEANPETLDEEKAACWLEAGVNRISLGVQSLDPAVLLRLGRACDPATARRALDLACRSFGRVSADWILAPGVDPQALRAELKEAVERGVEHISLYILEVHAGTPLAGDVAAGRLVLPRDQEIESGYLACVEELDGLGLAQYEVSNFALPGAESRHNRGYWNGEPWLALGPGAHGCWGRRRYANHADPDAWLGDIIFGRIPEAAVDPLDPAARRLERVILGLRTREGVPLAWLPPDAVDLDRGRREGLWNLDGERLALTPRGFLHIDTLEEALAGRLG